MRRFSLVSLIMCLMYMVAPAYASPLADLKSLASTPEQLTGQFEQTKYIAQIDASLKSSGEFSYQAGQEIVWHTLTPVENTLTLTPEQIISQQNGQVVSSINNQQSPVVAVFSDIFFGVMTAQWSLLENYFDITPELDGEQWHATLTPNDEQIAQAVTQVTLTGDKLLQHVVLTEPNGNTTDIHFINLANAKDAE